MPMLKKNKSMIKMNLKIIIVIIVIIRLMIKQEIFLSQAVYVKW